MVRHLLATAVLTASSAPAVAQIDPVAVGQGAVHSTTMRAHSNRIARGQRDGASPGSGRATSAQAAACAQKARFRSEHGADHPKVRRLYGLCRGVGL